MSPSSRRRSQSPSAVQQPPHPPHQFTFAKRTLRKLVEDSQFFKSLDEENNVGTIHEQDVVVGGLLGQGGFCEVRYCAAENKLTTSSGDDDNNCGGGNNDPEEQHQDAASKLLYDSPSPTSPQPQSSSSSSTTNIARYAIKYLSPTRTAPHPSDPKNKVFQRGIADLAMEACFLSLLRHENIITCHYVSAGSLEENFNAKDHDDGDSSPGRGKGKGGKKGTKKKIKVREEIVTDAMGNLVLREVPIVQDDHQDVENAVQNQQQQQQQVEVYKHRFGYFLLLDVLHETLAHRIDHVYIPQVLLSNDPTNNDGSLVASSDLTASLLHTCEKRESFLKRMSVKRPSLFQKHSNRDSINSSTASVSSSYSASTAGMRSSIANSNANNTDQLTRSHHDIIYNQKQKLAARLTSLLAIANALQYLHEHQILFRDIKPDNIGFYRDYSAQCTCGLRTSSTTGDNGQENVSKRDCTCFVEIPKLFDFGLAKELKSKYRVDDGHRRLQTNSRDYSEIKEYAHHDKGGLLRKSFSSSKSARISDEELNTVYKLTGCTGSRRYMAPEVCFNDPYNEKADVYSFGMMMYQVASLVTPFDGYSSYDHEKEVLRGGFRPDIDLPTKKDLLSCQRTEQELYEKLENGEDVGDDDHPELPSPSEKRNEVLVVKSKSVWTKDLKRLIDECWDYDMRYRPPMKEVVVRLQGCIDELTLSNPQQQLQQQQKKGRDSLEGRADVSRGSRNTANLLHQQGGGGNGGEEGKSNQKKDRGGASVVQVRPNVTENNSRESIKKKSFFRSSKSQGKDSGPAAAVAEMQQ